MKTKIFRNVVVRKKLRNIATAVFVVFLLSTFYFLNSNPVGATELLQPTIVIHPDIYYPLDEVLYLEGRAPANFVIQIQFQKSGAKPIRMTTKSDSNGEWVFADRAPLEAGNWEIRARVSEGEQVSEWSNPRIVKVLVAGIILGGITIKFAVLVLIIIGLLVIGGAGAFYYSRKVKRLREESQRALEQKEREILGSEVEQNFTELRRAGLRGGALIVIFAILILLILTFSSVFAKELQEPTIVVNPDVYYPLDEVLYLEGRAIPNYAIELRFQKQGAKPLTYRTKSDSRGEWVFAEKIRLAAGDWEVRARTVDSKNSENVSEWSNSRTFKVAVTGVTIGGIDIKFAALSLVIVALLVLGVMLVLYFTGRVSRLKAALLDKEIREAREAAHKGFSEMRQNLLDELKLLESRKNLSSEELERKAHLLRDLENLERDVEKEIDDIQEKR